MNSNGDDGSNTATNTNTNSHINTSTNADGSSSSGIMRILLRAPFPRAPLRPR